MLQWNSAEFMLSVHALKQLPEPLYPEIAFAGRSNVGKSSLLNTLIGRKGYVKVSSKPGKTQGLNFFLVDKRVYLVDLPGYGYARVSKNVQEGWQRLVSSYLTEREQLRLVVIILDIRHPPKLQDRQLINWLKHMNIPLLPVYTKVDKLSGNQKSKQAAVLDAGHAIAAGSRIIFSAKTGEGLPALKTMLGEYIA